MLFTLLAACLTSADDYAALQAQLEDLDGDGIVGRDDCDDSSADVYPGATEIPDDGLDNDCDPTTPDESPPISAWTGVVSASTLTHVDGVGTYYAFGQSVAVADLDDDGVAEAIVGSPRDQTTGTGAGALYVFPGPGEDDRGVFGNPTPLYGDVTGAVLVAGVGARISSLLTEEAAYILMGAESDGATGVALAIQYPPHDVDALTASTMTISGPAGFPTAITGWQASQALVVVSDAWSADSAVYAVPPNQSALSFSQLGTPVLESGGATDALGAALATGDLDGDGQDELLVGAPGADADAGRVYIARDLGGDYGYDVWLGSNGAGNSLSTGDFNGDGYIDFATRSDTATYLVLGPAHGGDLADADVVLASDVYAICLATDLDGDGKSDLVVGLPGEDNGGEVRVFYDLSAGSLALEDASLVIEARLQRDLFGESLAGGADLDGDGDDDLLVGASEALGANARNGAAYLIPGGGS